MKSTSCQIVTSNGTNIHYIASGNECDSPVIFLHGLGGSTETFAPLIPYFPQGHYLVAVDVEGFGKTPLNKSQPLSFPRYVADLHYIVSHLQERPVGADATANGDKQRSKCLLVGHSLGGIIGLHYAAQHPEDVAGLLLLGAGRSVRGIPPAQARMRALAETARTKGMDTVAKIAVKSNFPADRESSEDQKAEISKAVATCDPEAYARTAETVASDDHVDPDYATIRAPCIFIAGDGDLISPTQRSIDLSSLVGGATSLFVANSGHQMILQDLEVVKKAVDKLLACSK